MTTDNTSPAYGTTPGYVASTSYPAPPQSPYLNQGASNYVAGSVPPVGHGNVLFSGDWKANKVLYIIFLCFGLCFVGIGIMTMFAYDTFFLGVFFVIISIIWIAMFFLLQPTKVEVSHGFVLIHKRLSLCTRPIPLATIGSVVRIPYCGGEVVMLYRAFGIMRRNRIKLIVAQHEVEPLYNAIASQLNTNNTITVIV